MKLLDRIFRRNPILLCSDCFKDQGLRLDASSIGTERNNVRCSECGSYLGKKLTARQIEVLAYRYFVRGSLCRVEYGAAPVIQFNKSQTTEIHISPWLADDVRLLEKTIGIGLFYYGPRQWMLGEIGPLKALEEGATRPDVVQRILTEYPKIEFTPEQRFYRVRVAPAHPEEASEYDSPPIGVAGKGRLDEPKYPIMYGSQDLEVCIHECRVAAEDEVFVATLSPTRNLRLLDLTEILNEDVTEFESLDLAVYMLFLAGKHSYYISREIAVTARAVGFDGLVYPSYFSMLRTGGAPFETVLGISHRRIPQYGEYEKSKIVSNLALFGRPINSGDVRVVSIDRVILRRVQYGFHFGPVEC
jgi:hypothetical protein